MTNLTIKQTTVSEALIKAIKVYAAQNDLLILDVHEQAIQSLIKHRNRIEKKGKKIVYLVGPGEGKEVNIKLSESLLAKLADIAEHDNVPIRRILYTALLYFAYDHELGGVENADGYLVLVE